MIVEVPYFFEARIVRPRARKPEQIQVIGTLPIDIQEFSGDDIPVAARLSIECRIRPHFGSMTRIDYRVSPNGGLMRPCRADLRFDTTYAPPCRWTTLATVNQDLAEWMAACATATNPEWNMLPIRRDVGKPVFQKDVVAKQWITDNSEERKAELLAGFRRSAFVDGVLHVPSDGPALSVFSRTATSPEDNAATAEQFVLGVFPEPGAFPPYRHSTANRIFTIAEVDEAEIEALRTRDQAEQDARRLRRRHTILPGIERDGILDVFIADAGNLDHRKSLECDRIEGLFREVRPVLADLDPQAIRRFADLKSEWMTNNGWTVARLALFADDLVELLPGRSHSL